MVSVYVRNGNCLPTINVLTADFLADQKLFLWGTILRASFRASSAQIFDYRKLLGVRYFEILVVFINGSSIHDKHPVSCYDEHTFAFVATVDVDGILEKL